MGRLKIVSAKIALVLLIPCELVAAYKASFALWMTAYPLVDNYEWALRFYQRFAICLAIAVLWITVAMWLYREKKQDSAAGAGNSN